MTVVVENLVCPLLAIPDNSPGGRFGRTISRVSRGLTIAASALFDLARRNGIIGSEPPVRGPLFGMSNGRVGGATVALERGSAHGRAV